jgi:hypothetical protein
VRAAPLLQPQRIEPLGVIHAVSCIS